MRYLITPLFIFTFSISLYSQQVSFDDIRKNYDDFEYDKVVQLTLEYLTQNDSISFDLFSELMIMNSVSLYIKNDLPGVRNCFFQILQRDKNYLIDSDKISPKIVKIFGEVKKEYDSFVPSKIENKIEQKVIEPETKYVYVKEKDKTGLIIKSVLLPGWAQMEAGKTKGYILTGLSTINLAGIIYYIFDANKKENLYLSENNRELIPEKYAGYNKSYKTRNILMVSYAILSLLSTADLLIFDDSTLGNSVAIHPTLNENNRLGLAFTIRF